MPAGSVASGPVDFWRALSPLLTGCRMLRKLRLPLRPGPQGRDGYEPSMKRGPTRVSALVGGLGPEIRREIQFLSPDRVLPALRARLFIIHSDPDPYIPVTEALRIEAALRGRGNVHVAILHSFTHVQPDFPKLDVRNFFTVYVPEGWKIFRVVFDLLQEGH